ncbi:copper homeostasis protein CutC [Deinococcus cellulosilyticus]|uniref:Copper homeostasis protein cutC homolog n=1 Tax=Deinococcus cellulosilyticus (strain DSM 18568 / NBRC 106333 / KACC 11606 / 5516J-15) TaxID=1223518 RepID=A0A511N561_DEIC1|nr:copper homeostasis protein CutC [Deinococcus cellulosilyticus]GEM47984.1 hypothetical protein DC3_36190 [Deinococcus cellulosilyticus NBRC 106333 = KACC 11606]
MLAEVMIENATELRMVQNLGAHSVLLARQVVKGGISPDLKTLDEIREASRIPFTVLVRPDELGQQYENERKNKLLGHLRAYRQAGIEGVALGVREEDFVDVFFLEDILSFGFKITFYGFNGLKSLPQMLKMLNMYPRVCRIITRGNQASSWEGRTTIRELAEMARPGLEVFAEGVGLHPNNLAEFVQHSGAHGLLWGSTVRDASERLDLVLLEQLIDIMVHKTSRRF